MSDSLAKTVNNESIQLMVNTFYPKILKDPVVSGFFIEKLGADINSKVWQEHLLLLGQFWSLMSLGDEGYRGSPLAPHFQIEGLSREAFEQWLFLFHETVDEIFIPKLGLFFKEKNSDIAQNFMRNLGI